jgi:hypothetical protein
MQSNFQALKPPFVLSRPQVSRAHNFMQFLSEMVLQEETFQLKWVEPERFAALQDDARSLLSICQKDDFMVMLIEHAWSEAVDLGSVRQDDTVQLPSGNMVFEFVVNGVHFLWWYMQMEGWDKNGSMIARYCGQGPSDHGQWAVMTKAHKEDLKDNELQLALFSPQKSARDSTDNILVPDDLDDFLVKNVYAACVVLDAELAYREVVRAPHKLNAARAKKGKLPLYSYHIIKLANRKRAAALPDAQSQESGRRLRMHFVRGHWRHFEEHKTWVKWHVRGDPDLGRIEKEYRL